MKDISTSQSFAQDTIRRGEVVPLMEQFYTIQGEGAHTGKAAYFVRIGGCDVGCHWCDVKESWNPDTHPPTPIDSIVEEAKKYSDTVVVTGGEPLTWNMNPLVDAFHAEGITVHVETPTKLTSDQKKLFEQLAQMDSNSSNPMASNFFDKVKDLFQ